MRNALHTKRHFHQKRERERKFEEHFAEMPMFAKIDPDVECIEGGEILEY